jgi:putative Mg2+ transporter-C (MgtC) family protein
MMALEWLSAHRTATPEFEILIRFIIAIALGGAIGLDRELRNHPAGLRTHMLTALAAALFTLLTFEIAARFATAANEGTRLDPLRIVEAVTAGVAFLAAGAIIQAGPRRIHGLTTGASMWLAGAIGLCCGAGFYSIAVMATIIAVLILSALKWLERRIGIDNERRRSG